ncbi:hypothetical protein [Syntrophobacter fumaroxidans]|uniref:hypothetical protein n=1 Tax=Syntrophobacter fumaroxidans TaxID=119484 RepID=UPI0012376DA0|nr:hypothetical protein [Syntrophobacter fumaroxidans]
MITEEERDWLRIRWEFLRRDPEYLRLWEQFHDWQTGKIQIGDDSDLLLALVDGFARFGLGQWVDPALDFEKISEGNLPDAWGNRLTIEHLMSTKCHTVLIDDLPFDGSRFATTLTIHIDLGRVNSRTALKAHINGIIDRYLDDPNIRKRPKRKTDYERILEIGRLHESGMSNREIATHMYPNEFVDPGNLFDENSALPNPENAERKVSHALDRYHQLINGGHIDMTYP